MVVERGEVDLALLLLTVMLAQAVQDNRLRISKSRIISLKILDCQENAEVQVQ